MEFETRSCRRTAERVDLGRGCWFCAIGLSGGVREGDLDTENQVRRAHRKHIEGTKVRPGNCL
jgi:hypothetical protein